MSAPLFSLPFWDKLSQSQTVLLAGAGGGYDVFCALPLFRRLKDAGKTVHLANLSFSDVGGATGKWVTPTLLRVDADSLGNENYFPELHLARFLRGRGEETPIYCFEASGVAPTRENYEALVQDLKPDALVLVDGGTDSLMRGDEAGIGTPVEDIASILATRDLEIKHKMLACLGFGIDAFHGVCHAYFLEAVAQLTEMGAHLGTWSVMNQTLEANFYRDASEFVFRKMSRHPSIVSSSILSAIEGRFGDYHTNPRTRDSELFINPLMGLYWTFELEYVTGRVLYPAFIEETRTARELMGIIETFRHNTPHKPFKVLPM